MMGQTMPAGWRESGYCLRIALYHFCPGDDSVFSSRLLNPHRIFVCHLPKGELKIAHPFKGLSLPTSFLWLYESFCCTPQKARKHGGSNQLPTGAGVVRALGSKAPGRRHTLVVHKKSQLAYTQCLASSV